MTTYRALALDPDSCLDAELNKTNLPSLTVSKAVNAEQLLSWATNQPVDLVFLDLNMPDISGLQMVAEVRRQRPNMPAILLTSKEPSESIWREAASKPFIEVIQTPVSAGELQFRLDRLMSNARPRIPEPSPLKVAPVDVLRNDDSGRLDVNQISDVFGLSVTDIAKCIERTRQTIVKTPDSLSIQASLHHFERVARGLLTVTGSIKGLKMWLNSPNPVFEEHSPLEVLKLGKLELLADTVDDILLGHPD